MNHSPTLKKQHKNNRNGDAMLEWQLYTSKHAYFLSINILVSLMNIMTSKCVNKCSETNYKLMIPAFKADLEIYLT